jgi:hypothetical protein
MIPGIIVAYTIGMTRNTDSRLLRSVMELRSDYIDFGSDAEVESLAADIADWESRPVVSPRAISLGAWIVRARRISQQTRRAA